VQQFRGGLVFKAHRLCVSLNSRLEGNKEEEEEESKVGALAIFAKRKKMRNVVKLFAIRKKNIFAKSNDAFSQGVLLTVSAVQSALKVGQHRLF